MSIIKMQVDISGIVTASASIDVPMDGVLESVNLGVMFSVDGTPATGDNIGAEVSFLSTDNIGGGHDSRGSLCEAAAVMLTTLANTVCAASVPLAFVNGIDVRVNAGERIFIHGVASQADITGRASAYLFIRDKGDGRPSSRRR